MTRGHDCLSNGKLRSSMGHLALMVSLWGRRGGAAQYVGQRIKNKSMRECHPIKKKSRVIERKKQQTATNPHSLLHQIRKKRPQTPNSKSPAGMFRVRKLRDTFQSCLQPATTPPRCPLDAAFCCLAAGNIMQIFSRILALEEKEEEEEEKEERKKREKMCRKRLSIV